MAIDTEVGLADDRWKGAAELELYLSEIFWQDAIVEGITEFWVFAGEPYAQPVPGCGKRRVSRRMKMRG